MTLLDTFEMETDALDGPGFMFCQSCGEAVCAVHGSTLAELVTEAEGHKCDTGEPT